MTKEPFRICLTMAGAVSAGAYTAGVIDYFLETLKLWEVAKNSGDSSIPTHDVQLEVISGASAGGIVGTLLLIALLEGNTKKLKQAWVDMADDEVEDTLLKMLKTNDIKAPENKVLSLLNSLPLESISDQMLAIKQMGNFPKFVSKDLDLILTISNLRGLQFNINFEGTSKESGTVITSHGGFFRYRIQNNNNPTGIANDDGLYFVLDLENKAHRDFLSSATLATSAFPIGLKARENSIPKIYLERYAKYLFPNKQGITAEIPEEDPFKFSSVDGGLINNEPFGYALKVLQEKCETAVNSEQYGMIMINPFPNFGESLPPHEPKLDILKVAQLSFKALRNQVMFKQDEILDALDENFNTRFLIAPRRRSNLSNQLVAKNPLACGALAGFSGFLGKTFREHDFELGRLNCQSFLRYHFAIPIEEIPNKFNQPVSGTAMERFSFARPQGDENGQKFFPIIPDLRVLNAFSNIYDKKNYPKDAVLSYPDFPQISMKAIEDSYKKPGKKRIGKVAKTFINYRFINSTIRNKIYNYLMEQIEKGLKEHGLLKETPKEKSGLFGRWW